MTKENEMGNAKTHETSVRGYKVAGQRIKGGKHGGLSNAAERQMVKDGFIPSFEMSQAQLKAAGERKLLGRLPARMVKKLMWQDYMAGQDYMMG